MGGFIDFELIPGNVPNMGEMFVYHEKNGRSGHLGHALAEFGKDKIIAFYSDCSGTRNKWAPGHNGFGWMNYKISNDGGKSWSDPYRFDYSWDCFINQPYTISCEKAVSPAENEIVVFCLRNENPNGWEPYLEPTVVRSVDGGKTWSDAAVMCDKKGRIYDALVHDGAIYVLMLANDDFLAKLPEHRYYIYKSSDGGRSFSLHGELPGDVVGYAYGNMVVRDDGRLLCVVYNSKDEYNMPYYISSDMGKTWDVLGKSYVRKRIRNPQLAKVVGGYLLCGRAGCMSNELPMHFVLYTSRDGITWDDGLYISENGQTAYYSNMLELNGGKTVLIQASVPYSKGRTNISHWMINIK